MNDKQAALDMALKQIEKQFGTGSIIKMGKAHIQKLRHLAQVH